MLRTTNASTSTPVSLLLNCLLWLSLTFTTIVLHLTASSLNTRLPIRDTRQKFFTLCLFYFTVHRSRKNLRNPSTFTYIITSVASSRVAQPLIGKRALTAVPVKFLCFIMFRSRSAISIAPNRFDLRCAEIAPVAICDFNYARMQIEMYEPGYSSVCNVQSSDLSFAALRLKNCDLCVNAP